MTCPECEALECDYRRTMRHINAVVVGRFPNIPEKLYALRRWQEQRDATIEALYSHKQHHKQDVVTDDENMSVA